MKPNDPILAGLLAIVMALVLCVNFVMAGPTAEMVKEVVDYYYTGQKEGPVLTEVKLCTSVKDLECVDSIDTGSVPLGKPIKVWMRFLVPKGSTYDDILVEYKYENTPWRVLPHKIESSIRYRLVDTYTLEKPGNWTVSVKRGASVLKSVNLIVPPK